MDQLGMAIAVATCAAFLAGCVTSGEASRKPARAKEPENWAVIRAIDPMTDKPMCRVTGQPSLEYAMRSGRWLFRIAPFVERHGDEVVSGFTAAYANLGEAPPGVTMNSVEFRFDSGEPVRVAPAPSHTFVFKGKDALDFLNRLLTSDRLVYRINDRSVVEMKLQGFREKWAECGIG